jgi:hypothetical protein
MITTRRLIAAISLTLLMVLPWLVLPVSNCPERSFGWIDDADAVATASNEVPRFAESEAFRGTWTGPEDVFLWEACRNVTGDLLSPRDQGRVGACVGFGTASAIEHLLCVQIAIDRRHGFRPLAAEAIYAGSRVEIGQGRVRGDGSVGVWAARFVQDYGIVPRGRYGALDLLEYRENVCRDLGRRGLPGDVEAIAKQHPVRSIANVRSWDEAVAAIRNGYPIAVCSRQGFVMNRDGEGFCMPAGVWMHCLALVGIQGGRRPGGFLLNSWGATAHSGPRGAGSPSVAGFWADATVIDGMLRQGDSWAFSDAVGFPAKPMDWYAKIVRTPEIVADPR